MGKLDGRDRPALPKRDAATRRRGRFDRQDEKDAAIVGRCILVVDGVRVDVSSWARAHPGGAGVLQKYNGRDATRAFAAVGHSDHARSLLKKFSIEQPRNAPSAETDACKKDGKFRSRCRWMTKLFTAEDRFMVHKSLGAFCLCNYAYRFYHMLFGDPSAHMGRRGGDGPLSVAAIVCLAPHCLLSLSSFIFHTVPRERVVGKPMIWQEFRAHNIIFGMRSIVCSVASWLSIYTEHRWRTAAVVSSCAAVLAACAAADWATARFRANESESTTATMPYWDGCNPTTMRLFKHSYAVAQFGATATCLMVTNPAWPLAILLPIQGASFLMTLVRKSIITTRSYHAWYLASLLSVFGVGIRYILLTWNVELLAMWVVVMVAYFLRWKGVDKYAIWVPIVTVRIGMVMAGDRYVSYQSW